MPEENDPTPPPMDDDPSKKPSEGPPPPADADSPPPAEGDSPPPAESEAPPPIGDSAGEVPPPMDADTGAPPALDFPGLGQGSMSEKDEKLWGMLCHLLVFAPIALSLIPGIQLGGVFVFVGPLVVWLWKRQESPFVDEHGKESLNQQIVVAAVMLVGAVLTMICIGIFVVIAAAIYDVVVVILASLKANEGKGYRYPFSYRFIK